MTTASDSPAASRWAPQQPKAIQFYSYPTPNGVKVSLMLEETGLPYDAHLVDFGKGDQKTPAFLAVNPNGKIPAIYDPEGPDGRPVTLFESGAILLYLAEKSGKFMPADQKWQITQWLMFQMAGIGPMFGQFGFFHHYAGKAVEDPLPRERYRAEAARLLTVLDGALEGQDWIAGDYSIADMAIGPWLHGMMHHYKGAEAVGWNDLKNVPAYFARFMARPAVQRALNIPAVA
ncbi:glutathione S-transferase family protein [Falsigemmobacter faecalis]|uniref:Glutathione S-transferase n=1 Tax=Falsigemmobacter faecalis TaxID=2488730 RepID=A0A3P3DX09_9RHOB|nr:glutathione S-transferase N-terminal domain-containing protein [Falsigemmobacter faecalis]RRH77278.1 glutathione S-transferase [Falsigemmobacter faecalis]